MHNSVVNKGFALWPIAPLFGGDDDEAGKKTEAGSQNNGAGNSGASNSSTDKSGTKNSSSSNSSTDDDDSDDDDDEDSAYGSMSAKELRRELERKEKDGKTAAKDLAAAQKIIDDAERAERTEIDNLKTDLKNVTEERDEIAKFAESQAIVNGIVLNKDFEFHDASDVVHFITRSELTIDTKTGKVEGLDKEIKRVAKDKPHLVLKSKAKTNENNGQNNNGNNNGNQNGQQSGGPSGFQPGQGGGANNANKEERGGLMKKYSSLANR